MKLGVFFVQALTGAPYPYVQYGKPTKATYDFAEKLLRARITEVHGASVGPNIQPRLLVGVLPLFLYAVLNKALNLLRTQLYGRG